MSSSVSARELLTEYINKYFIYKVKARNMPEEMEVVVFSLDAKHQWGKVRVKITPVFGPFVDNFWVESKNLDPIDRLELITTNNDSTILQIDNIEHNLLFAPNSKHIKTIEPIELTLPKVS